MGIKICTFEDCKNKHDSHGFCANHARQYLKHGHPLSKEEKSKHLSEASKLKKQNIGKNWKIKDTSNMMGRHPKSEFKKGENIGEESPSWKGNNIGVTHLHRRIRSLIVKPDVCPKCEQDKKLELSNKKHDYQFDLSGWEWLCHKCHMISDGRMDRLFIKKVEV